MACMRSSICFIDASRMKALQAELRNPAPPSTQNSADEGNLKQQVDALERRAAELEFKVIKSATFAPD